MPIQQQNYVYNFVLKVILHNNPSKRVGKIVYLTHMLTHQPTNVLNNVPKFKIFSKIMRIGHVSMIVSQAILPRKKEDSVFRFANQMRPTYLPST